MATKEYIVKVTNDLIPNAFEKFEDCWSPEELVRCKDCVHRGACELCDGFGVNREWFCADGRKPETDKKEYDKDKLNEVLDGLHWILYNDDKLGLGTYWPEKKKPQNEREQAGYNVQRAIDFLRRLKGNLGQQ